jgi:hypothetical protein
MFKMAGVQLRQYHPDCGDVFIDFRPEIWVNSFLHLVAS